MIIELNSYEGPNNGPPILLLHGSSSRWQSFYPIIPDLTKHLHVFAVDLRGHGQSSWADSYLIQDYVQDIISFIKNHIKQPTIIFGNSFGGMIAIMIAASYPELAQSIIIGDGPITLESLYHLIDKQRDFAHQIIDWLRLKQVNNIYQALKNDILAENISLCDPEVFIAMFNNYEQTFFEYSTIKLFPKIKCPVLIIHGLEANGSLTTESDIQHATKILKNISHVHLSTVGHDIMEDKSEVLNNLNLFFTKYGFL